MPCQAHVVGCLVKPMSRHVEPMSRHVEPVSRHVEPVSRHVKPLLWHAFCPYCGISIHILACLVKPMSWGALSSPCRGMSWQGMASPASSILFYASFKKHLSWPLHFMFVHALAFFMPCAWHRARQDMPCRADVVACLVPMSWHVKPCSCMPCQAKVVAWLVKPMS